jgi:hypothetical protein
MVLPFAITRMPLHNIVKVPKGLLYDFLISCVHVCNVDCTTNFFSLLDIVALLHILIYLVFYQIFLLYTH